ncbi:response regulator [Terrimonas sp. NA20]|uniref:Response regulator n=1 Tax=Terrimonas ginsenosidimutans TaxID=2908004 RepID=A0ABS9KVC1_9BACT|nr:response regulator [Terrimonas ginsenosidimutans]MCG2616297.1 response regulator [Terrimonas ginsenosidimutans]
MKKILLIEDNENIRANTLEILELSGYEVIEAEEGKTGIVKAIQNKPDLIICDIMMPELDGYGVLRAIQNNDTIRNTPFIFLTAKTEHSDFRKGMESGADDYLTKPFDGNELLNAVSVRLKKMDLAHAEVQPGMNTAQQLPEVSSGKKEFENLTVGRNINHYAKKQVIYSEGNHPNRLYYVLKGQIKVFKTNGNGKELVTDLFSEGEFLGHTALLENSAYKDTAAALEDAELAVIPKEDFDKLIDCYPEIAKKFIQLLARNISDKELQLLKLAYSSLRKKVANALLLIQKKHKGSSRDFTIELSRQNLSNIAGTATESLIRTLTDFKNENLIDIQEGCISILNQKKLENLPD